MTERRFRKFSESNIVNKVVKLFYWENVKESFNLSLDSNQENRVVTSGDEIQDAPLKIKPIWDAYVRQERFARRLWRIAAYMAIMYVISTYIIGPMFGWPSIMVRGKLAHWWYMHTLMPDVLLMQFLIFFVFDATFMCFLFVRKIQKKRSEWPTETLSRFGLQLQLPQDSVMHDWVDLDFVGRRTRCVGSLVYFPFVLIALLVISRSTVFANFAPNLAVLMTQGISLTFVFASTVMLWWAATTVRDTTRRNLMNRIISAKARGAESSGYAQQLEVLLLRVEQLKEGAFGPISQQPLVRAVLLPLGSFGWASLIERGIFPGL